jgi:ribosomal protein S19
VGQEVIDVVAVVVYAGREFVPVVVEDISEMVAVVV